MKIYINRDYLSLGDDDILQFSDTLGIIRYYEEVEDEAYASGNENSKKYLKEKEFLLLLLSSLLKYIGSPYTTNDYILSSWCNRDTHISSSVISGLKMIRQQKINYINCFDGDMVGIRWFMNDNVDKKLVDKISIHRDSYFSESGRFYDDIRNIDECIAICLGEDFEKQIPFGELKQKYF